MCHGYAAPDDVAAAGTTPWTFDYPLYNGMHFYDGTGIECNGDGPERSNWTLDVARSEIAYDTVSNRTPDGDEEGSDASYWRGTVTVAHSGGAADPEEQLLRLIGSGAFQGGKTIHVHTYRNAGQVRPPHLVAAQVLKSPSLRFRPSPSFPANAPMARRRPLAPFLTILCGLLAGCGAESPPPDPRLSEIGDDAWTVEDVRVQQGGAEAPAGEHGPAVAAGEPFRLTGRIVAPDGAPVRVTRATLMVYNPTPEADIIAGTSGEVAVGPGGALEVQFRPIGRPGDYRVRGVFPRSPDKEEFNVDFGSLTVTKN